MTPGQHKRANALIRQECCNYDGGFCLIPHRGEEQPCPQLISYTVLCKWFWNAVLPLDETLHAELTEPQGLKRCAECGAAFLPKSNSAKYCAGCAETVRRRKKNESSRKRRRNADK